jgi:glycine betaine/proline transport system substrate-binding protein
VNCQKTTQRDVFLDAWLPNSQNYWADYGENLVVIGEAFSDATTGLVVPTYVTINSIEELNANKDKFKVKLLVLVVALVFIATRLKQ